ARQYTGSHKPISVVSTKSGWYVVSIGPMDKSEAIEAIASMKARGEIPNDSITSKGSTYGTVLLKIGLPPV
ncbi:MAG: SPOR domain-containing protein, partial [Bacteroides sp.]|nr:SPOR domain-containing protein [Bacteroides sp.]